ncbi:MAG: DUF2127 domain-containing protein [Cyanobacteria bacterium SID2]|nr:DUF2127 domain-containing protein [Cyanobacteria bacterium SID2]MBP0004944.1 DUF2127 domain-containing protein [Cyanobacteria bacterium SBC]
MDAPPHRSTATTLIVAYKSLLVVLLVAIAIVSAFSWRNYDALAAVARDYVVEGELTLTRWILDVILNADVRNLRLIARASSIYAICLGVATVGFWYGKRWAHLTFALLVGALIPVEIFELLHGVTPARSITVTLNLVVFVYLFRGWWLERNPETVSTPK